MRDLRAGHRPASSATWAVPAAFAVGVAVVLFAAVGCSPAGAAGVSAVAAILSMVATTAYAVIAALQWKAIRRQAELTHSLVESAERPAMVLADTVFGHSADATIDRLHFTLTNAGQGMALGVRAELGGTIGEQPIVGHAGRPRVFAARQSTPTTISFDAGALRWDGIRLGTAQLNVTVRVAYSDQNGVRYTALYELGYDRAAGSTIIVAGDIQRIGDGNDDA